MADILKWEERKTRKPHKCWGCGLTYEPAIKMVYASYADEGTVHSCYWCKTCQEYMTRRIDPQDGVGYRELLLNDPEGWQEIFDELNLVEVE